MFIKVPIGFEGKIKIDGHRQKHVIANKKCHLTDTINSSYCKPIPRKT